MTKRLDKALGAVRAMVLALFVFAQVLPSGYALASDGDGGVELVICTADGAKSVSWEEFTGEPSPFDAPSHEDKDCPACHTTCRVGFAVTPDLERLSHPWVEHYPAVPPAASPSSFVRVTRPPMPSRAPPAFPA